MSEVQIDGASPVSYKEKGLEDLAEAMLENAMEDSLHGGMYGAMLGKGREDDASFWKQVINLYRLEAGAGEPLRAMAGEVRAGGEEELARCIESTIGEELEHARRLEAVFKARGIDCLKQRPDPGLRRADAGMGPPSGRAEAGTLNAPAGVSF